MVWPLIYCHLLKLCRWLPLFRQWLWWVNPYHNWFNWLTNNTQAIVFTLIKLFKASENQGWGADPISSQQGAIWKTHLLWTLSDAAFRRMLHSLIVCLEANYFSLNMWSLQAVPVLLSEIWPHVCGVIKLLLHGHFQSVCQNCYCLRHTWWMCLIECVVSVFSLVCSAGMGQADTSPG